MVRRLYDPALVPTLFTKIIEGEIPGRFVWRDDRAVAFLTIEPLSPGHTLVVPIDEVDHWIDLPDDLAAHLIVVAKTIGTAIERAFQPARIGLIVAGMEVPHAHLHVLAINRESDLHFGNADRNARAEDLDAAAAAIRAELEAMGHHPPAG
jgi:histidine triad (HIT) family protein